MDYKQSLNLPKTDFPMRGNLPTREPEILSRWKSSRLYQQLLDQNRAGSQYLLHDGPPYANGNVHLGTALNKILKDVIVKYHLMSGHHAPYVPGWDCHGMPIEHQVVRQLGAEARTLSQVEIRRRCREYADKYFNVQREQFQRLGVLGDWENPYLTMSPQFEAGIVRMFRRLVEGGFIYRGLRPVHWCPTCSTALAEAEVEYSEHRSPSIYVRFRFTGSPEQAGSMALSPEYSAKLSTGAGRLSIVIWTTTPWTLPANLAVCLNPHLEYVALKVDDELLIVAERLREAFLQATGLISDAIYPVDLSAFDGKDVFAHPFLPRPSRLTFESHVTADAGTGCVHTAPGHGYEDFQVGQKYGLEVLTPVDGSGRFTADAGVYEGRNVFETNEAIVEDLRNSGALVHGEVLAHSYPHCWRCKSALIFRATEQWFLRIDHDGLREAALREIDAVRWVPRWGHDRIRHMMETRPDWCLSRQRAWGVPIPAFHCRSCGAIHNSPDVIRRVEQIFGEQGSDAWYTMSANQLLPDGYRCSCGSADFETDKNILDVWFDAGSSHDAVLREGGLGWPADLYVEAVDQHRGWFQVSLITSVATEHKAPYRSVLTHGLILDAAAKKMSKSLGNVVSPDEVVEKYGADILRLLFMSVDSTADTCFSKNLVTPLLEAYRKIRNTCRFLLGNLDGFDPSLHVVSTADLPEIDRWILHRTQRLIARSLEAYEGFAFHHIVQGLIQFCAIDLSALYLDIAKDRLYCSAPDSLERRAAQTTLWKILNAIVRLMAPMLSFTADEIWGFVPGRTATTVFEAGLPAVDPALVDEALAEKWEQLLAVRGAVTKALEAERQADRIGHSLDARVRLGGTNGLSVLLQEHAADLPALFIVSQVDVATDLGSDAVSPLLSDLRLVVERARGGKCERCWNYSEVVGTNAEHPGLCGRCLAVMAAVHP